MDLDIDADKSVKTEITNEVLNTIKKNEEVIDKDKYLDLNPFYDVNTKTVNFPEDYNIEITNLPAGTTTLIFCTKNAKFNQLVKNLPDSITKMNLGFEYNQSVDYLPKNLLHLELGYEFNQEVDNLPNTLTHLIIGANFNKSIDNLPTGLKFLKLDFEFNCPVDNLPQTLEHLELSYYFSHSVDNLPKTLKYLEFGCEFDLPVDKLPEGLETLIFGYSFDKNVDNLPDNISYLSFGGHFKQPITKFPSMLKRLNIFSSSPIKNNLPLTIENLFIIPHQLEENIVPDPIINIPSSLKEIKIHKRDEKIIEKIPFGCVIKIFEDAQ
jgi:hypothetical protein